LGRRSCEFCDAMCLYQRDGGERAPVWGGTAKAEGDSARVSRLDIDNEFISGTDLGNRLVSANGKW
jgi:hypothetical protein